MTKKSFLVYFFFFYFGPCHQFSVPASVSSPEKFISQEKSVSQETTLGSLELLRLLNIVPNANTAPMFVSRMWRAVPVRLPVRRFATSNQLFKTLDTRYSAPDVQKVLEKGEVTLPEFLDLSVVQPKLKKSVARLNYDALTPVQSKSLMPMLMEDGVVCRAKTGTGKTMAFAIPVLQSCLETYKATGDVSKVEALVIAPTRDLALQIQQEFAKLIGSDKSLSSKFEVRLCIGGKVDRPSRRAPAIVVATPGRLEANLRDPRYLRMFSDLKYKVYDEADRLLDQGFEEVLRDIDERLEQAKSYALDNNVTTKNVLFSATVDDRVNQFAVLTIGKDYTYINCVNENEPEAHENIDQTIVKTKDICQSHIAAIGDIFRKREEDANYKAILFVPTVIGSEFLFEVVSELNSQSRMRNWVYKLNGNMTQGRRDRTTQRFRTCKSGLLICTDVAARGLDFKNVTDVIQICPSLDVADYVHKVGRTARAGTSGNATIYLSEPEYKYKKVLEKERGIRFANEVEYTTFEEDRQKIEEVLVSSDDVEEYVKSMFGFYKGAVSVYRLQLDTVMRDLVNLLRCFTADPSATVEMSRKRFMMMGLPWSLVPLHFEVEGGAPNSGKHNNYRSNNFRKSYNLNDRPSYQKRFSGQRDFDSDFGGKQKYSNDRRSKRTFDDEAKFKNKRRY